MKFEEAKNQFLNTWGTLGSEWGINRTVAQVHALLLISHQPLSTDDIMEELQVSRGNANQSLRELMDWNLVSKQIKAGERKEFFVAEKDIWEVARRIAAERKRREIEPVRRTLSALRDIDGDRKKPEVKEFTHMMNQLDGFVGKMDKGVELMINSKESWFFGTLLKLMK